MRFASFSASVVVAAPPLAAMASAISRRRRVELRGSGRLLAL
jgi:hypothetical protein